MGDNLYFLLVLKFGFLAGPVTAMHGAQGSCKIDEGCYLDRTCLNTYCQSLTVLEYNWAKLSAIGPQLGQAE